MFGMEMMIKALGIEPEMITKSIENVSAVAKEIAERLERIETKIDKLQKQFDDWETMAIETVSDPDLNIVFDNPTLDEKEKTVQSE